MLHDAYLNPKDRTEEASTFYASILGAIEGGHPTLTRLAAHLEASA